MVPASVAENTVVLVGLDSSEYHQRVSRWLASFVWLLGACDRLFALDEVSPLVRDGGPGSTGDASGSCAIDDPFEGDAFASWWASYDPVNVTLSGDAVYMVLGQGATPAQAYTQLSSFDQHSFVGSRASVRLVSPPSSGVIAGLFVDTSGPGFSVETIVFEDKVLCNWIVDSSGYQSCTSVAYSSTTTHYLGVRRDGDGRTVHFERSLDGLAWNEIHSVDLPTFPTMNLEVGVYVFAEQALASHSPVVFDNFRYCPL